MESTFGLTQSQQFFTIQYYDGVALHKIKINASDKQYQNVKEMLQTLFSKSRSGNYQIAYKPMFMSKIEKKTIQLVQKSHIFRTLLPQFMIVAGKCYQTKFTSNEKNIQVKLHDFFNAFISKSSFIFQFLRLKNSR